MEKKLNLPKGSLPKKRLFDFKGLFEKLSALALAIVAISIVLGFPIMWLWNWLMPVIFSLPTITFFQAIGLVILLNTLFYRGK